MSRRFTIHVGSAEAKVEQSLPAPVIREINKVTSFELPGTWASSMGPQRSYLFSRITQKFPVGLLKRVKKVIRTSGYKTKIIDYRKQIIIPDDKVLKIVDGLSIKPRWYQTDSLVDGIRNPYGLFHHATGTGKSVLISMLLKAYDCNSLILTHRRELLYQLKEVIERITGEEVGMIGDGHWEIKKWTVGIINSLLAKENVLEDAEKFLPTVEYLLLDEVHHLGSSTWIKLAKKCKNTKARHGFSGTCFRTDNADLLLLAHTGDIISKYSTSEMIEDGWLARPYIYSDKIDGPDTTSENWHVVEKEQIAENKKRNILGCQFVYDFVSQGKQILVMVKRVNHGNIIKKILSSEFGIEQRDIRYMNGSEDMYVRQRALSDYKYGVFPVLIGTSIYDEGIDLPMIGAAANLAGGTSDIKTVQRIGRILRKPVKEGEIDIDPNKEEIVYYYDPIDTGHRFVKKHSNMRQRVYKDEPAFVLKGPYQKISKENSKKISKIKN